VRKNLAPAIWVIATVVIGTAAATWYHQRRSDASAEVALVAEYNAGIIVGTAPVYVKWSFRNTDGYSWRVTLPPQSCGCAQIRLNRSVVPPGSLLVVTSTIHLPIGVTPEEPEKAFEERVLLPLVIRAKFRTYRVAGIVRGTIICPLVRGSSFLVAQFQKPSEFRQYCWQFHPQVHSKMFDVRCNLPPDCASLKVGRDSLCLVVRPPKEEETYEGDLKLYHKGDLNELLRIPIFVRMWGGRGS